MKKIKDITFVINGIFTILFGIVFSYISFQLTRFYAIFYIAIFLGIVISFGGYIILSWGLEEKPLHCR